MKAMETIQDLIEEAKIRTVWWALCIFSVTYFLTHTSKSMWMNLPMAILILGALRILLNQIEFRWKVMPDPRQSRLSYPDKKQLSLNDPRLSTTPPPPRWKKKIDSPVVEAAINDFIDKILNDFVINLWYSLITPDKEAPELIRGVIMDALGEISVRVKEINIVDLLTRDIVDLIGDHLEIFRKNHAAIGTDVMKTLSSEERDDRLKYHLMASGELYPALISPESEYKVLQKIVAGILSVVLRPREAQCPLVRTIAREIVTCLVVQPLLNLAAPERINEVLEIIINIIKEGNFEQFSGEEQSVYSASLSASDSQAKSMNLAKVDEQETPSVDDERHPELRIQQHSGDWARMLEVATQRRTEVLTPENLENMWTKGRNYKKKEHKKSLKTGSSVSTTTGAEEKAVVHLPPRVSVDKHSLAQIEEDISRTASCEGGRHMYEVGVRNEPPSDGNKNRLKRSNSTSDLLQPETRLALLGVGEGPLITDFYTSAYIKHNENHTCDSKSPNIVLHKESQQCSKLKCRVLGAYFEKLSSKSFAVYSIAVTDTENKTWFVKRRYSNFERLHRQLKEIPNYNLQLPPKRIFSSSTEDAFVHRRCIQLDKYLQDLLSIANVAEQYEVWDFLRESSKNYSFGKSSSVMKTLAVNVDDAMDDIVRQFKGVSGGLMRKVVGSPLEENDQVPARHLSWSVHDINTQLAKETATESMHSSISDNEDIDKLGENSQGEGRLVSEANGWHSDNELDSKCFPPRVVRRLGEPENVPFDKENDYKAKSEVRGFSDSQHADPSTSVAHSPTGVPEWNPPNVSVPILNLVDKVFQLNRRGWLRRQVFWISKQILQLVMEDAAEAAKVEAISRCENLSMVNNEEKKKLYAQVMSVGTNVNTLRKVLAGTNSCLADIFTMNMEFLHHLKENMESCAKQTGTNLSGWPQVSTWNFVDKEIFSRLSAALSNVNLHENSNGENITEICGSLSRNLDQFVADVSHLEENVSKHLASWQEHGNIVSNGIDTFFKSIGTGTDSEIAALGEKVALLHGACSSVLAEIESRKAELVGNDNFNMSLHQVEEDFSSMESVRSMVNRLSSAVKELVVANAETVERNEKEMKVIIANLQRELHEKDIQNDRMCNELVGQVKEAQAGAKIFAEDLQSTSTRMHDMQDQLSILVQERDALKERVKELQEGQASHSELQEKVTSLSNLLAAKDQEIEALMQALDEEESQMEDLKHRATELEQEVQQKNLDLQKAEASRGKISKKLSITVDKFDELHQLSENLLAEIEKLQQQVQDRDTEVSFLRQEVTRCTNEALVASQNDSKRDSEEIEAVLSWFNTIASLIGLEDSPSTDAQSHVNLYMETLEKKIASILSETEELRLVGQSKDSLLEAERSRVAELRQKEAALERILHEKESQPNMSASEIVEVEPLINKRMTSGASIPSQVRSLRKGNNDQVAISIDADQPDESLSLEDDDDKAHGFRSLTTSRVVPRFTRPVTNMIDGLWVSCDRTLMRQPALRLGIMIYWAILHALLASFVV